MGDIKQGITTFSYAGEFARQIFSFEDMLSSIHKLGFKGVEIIPGQVAPEYPYLSDNYIAYLKDLLAEYELEPVCWSAYIDNGIRSDRDLSPEEIKQFTINDMIYAKKAGFKMVRSQETISPKVFREMIPYCKELGVQLTIEMHHPDNPNVPVWQEYLDIMENEGKGWLGFVPDFGIFQNTPHQLWINDAINSGCRKEILDDMIEKHSKNLSYEEIVNGDYTPFEMNCAKDLINEFNGCAKLEDVIAHIDSVFHIHGKCYYLNDQCEEVSVPYRKVLNAFKDAGYKGYIACEYEGHLLDTSLKAEEQLEKYLKMTNSILIN